jgi:hypothetical protein
MRPISTTAALVVTGVLALLLVAYVFVGGSAGHADTVPHCTSQQALGQVKGELFRRAAGIRGTTDAGFQAVENYSVMRAASQLVRRHHSRSSKVSCTGRLALELPPGTSVVGGRHSLSASLAYDLVPQQGGGARLLVLGNADDIVVPLATVSNAGTQAGSLTGALPQADHGGQQAAPAPSPATPPTQRVQNAPPPPQPQKAVVPRPAPPPARAKPAPPPKRPPVAVAAAKPSFNCRYAKTRGEITVCGDAGLAALDRQMSAEYYRAVAAARPGQRTMLERSRNRFLRYRDSCGSEACIADAYRGRIREIGDIMSGRW